MHIVLRSRTTSSHKIRLNGGLRVTISTYTSRLTRLLLHNAVRERHHSWTEKSSILLLAVRNSRNIHRRLCRLLATLIRSNNGRHLNIAASNTTSRHNWRYHLLYLKRREIISNLARL